MRLAGRGWALVRARYGFNVTEAVVQMPAGQRVVPAYLLTNVLEEDLRGVLRPDEILVDSLRAPNGQLTCRRSLIGITGGIGSGKSVVARVFGLLGIPVYDSDHRAKWLMTNDEALRISLVDAFGP